MTPASLVSLLPANLHSTRTARVAAAKGRVGAFAGVQSSCAATWAAIDPHHIQARTCRPADRHMGTTGPSAAIGRAHGKNRTVAAGIDSSASQRRSVVRFSIGRNGEALRNRIRRAGFLKQGFGIDYGRTRFNDGWLSQSRPINACASPSRDRRLCVEASTIGKRCSGRRKACHLARLVNKQAHSSPSAISVEPITATK